MKLIDTFVRDDFGKEYCLTLFKFEKKSLIQTSVGWADDASSPLLHLNMSSSGLLSFFFYIHKFSFCFDFIAYTWH
jgi:hypothetical protein